MAPPKGNKFWEARSSHGRKPIFPDPETLWNAAVEYFEWNADNPLEEAIVYQGELSKEAKPLMRAMTLEGLLIFLDISRPCWYDYRDKDDFSTVSDRIENIIRAQKFEGASAGLLNANIIARDLGLTDKQDQQISGPNGGPQEHVWTVEVVNAPTTTE
jgi:hypothetical protein